MGLLVKKIKIIVVLFVVFAASGVLTAKTFSQEKADLSKVSFTTDQYLLKFLDRGTNKIYFYSDSTGELSEIWLIKELGQDLEKIYNRGSRVR